MKKEALFEIIGELDDRFLSITQRKKLHIPKKLLTAVACMVLFAAVVTQAMLMKGAEIPLMRTTDNVRVRRITDVPFYHVCTYHPSLSDYVPGVEFINQENVDIFKGKILSLQNIMIDYDGVTEYRALVTISVDQVYRGEPKSDTITILMPFGFYFSDHVFVEDTTVISHMEKGMEGIFLAKKYDEGDYSQVNGSNLSLMDIAEYGMSDGERWCFLMSEDGLIYDDVTHDALKGAATLSDVALYIKQSLEN